MINNFSPNEKADMYKSIFNSYKNASKKNYVELCNDVKSELEKELVQDVDIEGFDCGGEVE